MKNNKKKLKFKEEKKLHKTQRALLGFFQKMRRLVSFIFSNPSIKKYKKNKTGINKEKTNKKKMPSLATDKSDGRFRTEPQNEFVGLRFDYLLGDVEMRQIGDAAQK